MHDTFFGSELSATPSTASALAIGFAPELTFGSSAFSALGGHVESVAALSGDSFAPTPPFNFRLLLVFASFLVPYLAFLLILPGVREKRFVSFVAITIQIGVGLLLMASLILPYWKVGEVTVVSQFYSHSRLRHEAHLSVNVGLEYINITLNYIGTLNTAEVPFKGLYLNERYHMSGVRVMSEELRAAYRRGLPYPLLKVMEYFSLSQGAFAWGRLYRNAGYYTNAVLWLAFACWALQCVMLALVPHHYSKTGMMCGILALLSNCVYVGNTPSTDVKIPFESRSGETIFLLLHYGSCIYMSFFAGLIATAFGFILSLLQFLRLYSISTCLSGYLDDTVGPKCKWGHNNKVNDNRRIIPIEMKSVTKNSPRNANASNGWTTMNSSVTASTAASSTSSTNGDNTETYITDETASAGDLTPAASTGRAKALPRTRPEQKQQRNNACNNRQRLMPDSPDSGLAIQAIKNNGGKRSAYLLPNYNEQMLTADHQRSTDLYNRRNDARQNENGKWTPPTLKLPSSDADQENSLNRKYNDVSGSTLMSFISAPSSGLTPHSATTPKGGTNSPMRGESSGFQSSRSSFSDCSLAVDDDEETVRRSSLATGNAFFRFTDDEDEQGDDGGGGDDRGKSKKQNNSADGKSSKRSLFRLPQKSF